MARKLGMYSRTCPVLSRARVGPMPCVYRVDRARPGPIRAVSGFEREKKRSFHGARRGFRTTPAHESLVTGPLATLDPGARPTKPL